jgi:NodT family efflux transporter outer membrane factor (OMF) lipoprotein
MARRRLPGIVAALLAATLVASCTMWSVGPDYVEPAAPDAQRYSKEPLATYTASINAPGGQSQHFVPSKDVSAQWWTAFRSPQLNALIERSLKASPTLDAAVAALRAARENMLAQEGKYFPLIDANYTAQPQMTSQVISPTLSSSANPFTLHTAQLLVSYSPDVWGLNRRTVESLQALADNQRYQFEAAYVTLESNIIAAAVQEANLRDQIAATHKLIDINLEILDLMRKQLAAGYENRIDVATQEAQLAQMRATLPPLEKQLAQQRDLLAALAGRFPNDPPGETFVLASFRLPSDLPVSLPSTLIAQRPDVRAAAEQLHSASALVGVAIANMLPQFTITGGGGYTNNALAGLLAPQNVFYNFAAGVTQPVFDGFTLLHQKRAAEDNYDQAAAQYRSTVIGALQNVADSLRALQADAKSVRAGVEWERATKLSLDLTRQQLQNGYVNFILLLTAEQAYQQAVINLVQVRANRLADTAALFQALGGGWWNNKTDVAVAAVATVDATLALPTTNHE